MFRGLRKICALGLLGMLASAGAFAAASQFSVPLLADGTTLGSATGVLGVSPAAGGRVAWTLADGAFAPSAVPGTTIVWNDANLAGSGSAPAGEKTALKEFEVTVRQSSGVDVSFRFRLSATLSNDKATDLTIEQLR